MFELLERAAPFLRDIGGKFDAIEGKVCAAQQLQLIAHQEDVAEDGSDLILHGRDKGSDGAMVGSVAVGKGNENDVLMAGALDLARTEHAFGVSQQDDLEQDLGMDGGRAGQVVLVALIEDRQIDVLVHQPVEGVLESPWHELVLERNGEHDHLIFIAWFVFCHGGFLGYPIEPRLMALVIKFPAFSTVSTGTILTTKRDLL